MILYKLTKGSLLIVLAFRFQKRQVNFYERQAQNQ